MKLVELRIQQYQSHLDSTIKFTDGLNIIVGPSDSGKSSIIRALKKLIRDTPAGKGFITNGKTECEISLVFEFEGQLHKVVRKITSSKNLYYLDTKEFGGFGREIPLEVQTALDMALLDLENGDYVDLHFTNQHDHPFLLGDTASHRSRVLGRLTGLHILDKAIVNCNSQVKQASQRMDALKDYKKELDRELSALPDVVELEEDLKLRTIELAEIKKTSSDLLKLQLLQSQLVSIVSQGKSVLGELSKIPANIPTTDEVLRSAGVWSTLKRLQFEYNKVVASIEKETPSAEKIIGDTSEVSRLIRKRAQLIELRSKLAELNTLERSYNLSSIETQLKQEEENWNVELKKSGACPLCKRQF